MSLFAVVASVLSQPLTAGDLGGLSGWQWFMVCLVAILVVGWLLSYSASFSAQSPYLETLAQHAGESHAIEESHGVKASPEIHLGATDDLKIIEGIGPKIETLLKAEGIDTYAKLAQNDVEELRKILLAAGLRVNDPGSWPEQARLAANGDWAAFEALLATLRGGRKV